VYGCLSKGISTQGKLEADYALMKAKREDRTTVDQFDAKTTTLRQWQLNNKNIDDSTLIAQENVPINVCAKYPINYQYDKNTKGTWSVEDVDVPSGASFSGPFLYRPPKYPSSSATEITFDCSINGRPTSSIKMPTGVAHAILNCTKEIKITGSVSHAITKQNVQCSGNGSAQVVQESYEFLDGCGGGTWTLRKDTASYSCTSTQDTTIFKFAGNIDAAMKRYKILTSIGNADPVELDLSPNYFKGSNATKGNNDYIVESLYCLGKDPDKRSAFDDVAYAKAKQVGPDRNAVTELDTGCLVVDTYDTDLLRRDLGGLLLNGFPKIAVCDANYGGIISKEYLELARHNNQKFITSGPSLSASYTAGLAEYVGTSGTSEKLFQNRPCASKQIQVFRSPAGSPISTGIYFSMDGDCIDRNGGMTYRYGGVDFGAPTGDCVDCNTLTPQEKDTLPCEKSKQCYADSSIPLLVPRPSGTAYSEASSGCSVPWELSFHIGRYAETDLLGLNDEVKGYKILYERPLPLSIYKKNQEDSNLNISLAFSSNSPPIPQAPYINDGISDQAFGDYGYSIPLITTSKGYADYSANVSVGNLIKEAKQIGTLTLKSGDWSGATPLWTLHVSEKKGSCSGSVVSTLGGSGGWIVGCKQVPVMYCDGTADCCFPMYGCGKLKEYDCQESDPCERRLCQYSYSSSYKIECKDDLVCGDDIGTQPTNCTCCNCDCYDIDYEDPVTGERIGGYIDPCTPKNSSPPGPTTTKGGGALGCFGSAMDEDKLSTDINITLEFIPFTTAGGT
jgi:hypothetical protein